MTITMTTVMRALVVPGLLALGLAAMCAQEITLGQVLTGQHLDAPLTITFASVTPEWSQFSLLNENDDATAAMLRHVDSQEAAVLKAFSPYFTQGKTLTIGGDTYLIAYRRANPLKEAWRTAALQVMHGEEIDEPELLPNMLLLTPDTHLNLCLLNIKQAGSFIDIREAVRQAELDATAKVLEHAQQRALQTRSCSNLRQLTLALMMNAQDHNDVLPVLTAADDYLHILSISPEVAFHPVTEEHYRYNPAVSGKTIGAIKDLEKTPLFYEATSWPDGSRNVAYVDGHIANLSAAQWVALQQKWKLP